MLLIYLNLNDDGYVPINEFEGGPDDGKSRIWPVKVFRGVQPYDPMLGTLVVPHTTGTTDDSYWKNFDWEKSITAGMLSAGQPFSGKVAFFKKPLVSLARIFHMNADNGEIFYKIS